MTTSFRRFWRDERGATSIEYALIATLVSVLIVSGLTIMGTKLSTKFNTVGNQLL